MRSINHALTGAIIGFVSGVPLVAVPLAIASHYVLDVIPHYGEGEVLTNKPKVLRSQRFKLFLWVDAALCGLLVLILGVAQPTHWLLAAACAFSAAAPDFLSINRFRKALEHKPWQPGLYTKFAIGIQWFERPSGALVEISWFIGAVILIAPFLK